LQGQRQGGRVPRIARLRNACRPSAKEVDSPMLKRIRMRTPFRGNGPWIVIAAVLVALLVTPFALAAGENRPVRGGARNPSPNASLSYTRETQIIASTNTYGTRQSNKSATGGGAIYGCRARAGSNSCVRASNLSNGRAFSFSSNGGTEVGRIDGPAAAAPFTTSATGVATGLNADKVDGKDAATISNDANRFATVDSTGALGPARGATAAAHPSTGNYTVTFSEDISKCALAATVASTTIAGIATAVIGADTKTVTVVTRDAAAGAAPADAPFHLTVTC
jgi:hypothetical protein